MDEEAAAEERRRRPRWLLITLALLFLLAALLIALWSQRTGFATDIIDREFERRGVRATYDVAGIGLRTQRFENLVIGDPAAPDLTARVVEVDIVLGLHAPRIGLIRARGVRLKGRVVGDKVTFGEVDRLLPEPTGEPFRLPDQEVNVRDAGVTLETPLGAVGVGLSGRGNLANGFRGHVAGVSRQLVFGACAVLDPRAVMAIEVDRRRPSVAGPVRAASASCGETLDIANPEIALEARFSEALDRWEGGAEARIATLRTGPQALAGILARATIAGNANRTAGRSSIAAAGIVTDDFRAGRTVLAGDYAFYPRRGQVAFDGDANIIGLSARAASLSPIASALRGLGGTPLDPIGDALADALEAAAGAADVRARVRIVNGPAFGAARLEQVSATSRSGARLLIDGGTGFTYYWPDRLYRMDGDFALSGGGLPDTRFTIEQPRGGAPMRGIGRIAPFTAGRSRLALGVIRLDTGPGATRFQTTARIDGPFSGGEVEGLVLPLVGRFGGGALRIGETCVTARFDRLLIDDLRIGPTPLALCPPGQGLVWKAPGGPVQGGADIAAPRLAGTLGQTPIRLAADRLRFDLPTQTFVAPAFAARLGEADAVSGLDADRLDGRFTRRGLAGDYAGLSAFISGVPLSFYDGDGAWALEGGDTRLAGSFSVADAGEEGPRFYPLVSDDFALTILDSQVRATATARHPGTGARVTDIGVDHDLRTGSGRAVLDVPGISFTPGGFQPDDLTPLTVGVVALVDGSVTGQGRISWNEDETRSTGTFRTEGMNLAAPFGPVEGLDTEIEFTDLLGLVSAPGQLAEVGVIRTGIDVFDGRIRYQLLPDTRVRIEAGEWPFAGGTLSLEETVLDFSQETTKRLVFQVRGLEAASFIQQMEFGNIAATGTFDGTIPMEFDIRGGRIVGGQLVAREGGGTLSYIGEVSDAALGTFGKLAFDALKRLRYSRFIINLDGSLDGEFLTRIQLDGVNRITDNDNWIIRQFSNLPFRFNVRISGPLRAVIGTARSFEDPSILIQPVLPEELRDLPTIVSDLDEEESETER